MHWPFRGTGDVFITKEYPRPWISEMYGYVFGTAVAGLGHNVHEHPTLRGMSPWDEASTTRFSSITASSSRSTTGNGTNTTSSTDEE